MTITEIVNSLSACMRGDSTSRCESCAYSKDAGMDFSCRAKLRNDVIAMLNDKVTAEKVDDAIPIKWLRDKQYNLRSYVDHRPDAVVDYLIWLWDKEKEMK